MAGKDVRQHMDMEEMSLEKTFKVEGMHCASCEMLLADAIGEIAGVEKVAADSKKGTVTITADDAKAFDEAKKAIAKEGYKVIG